MFDSWFARISFIVVVLIISCILLFVRIALTYESSLCIIPFWYWLSMSAFNMPDSLLLIYLDSMCYETYNLYSNSIGIDYLLGYSSYSPFLSQINATLYDLLGIPTYPYLGFQYHTTFPYTPLLSSIIPYARFYYPAYAYGSPWFYLNWVLLQ